MTETTGAKDAIRQCSRMEYLEVSRVLCRSMGCRQPVAMAQCVLEWSENEESLKSLLEEDDTFEFGHENLPVRVLFARHVRFVEDRARCPKFFCWPAMHFVAHPTADVDLDASKELFDRHCPLFIAVLFGNGLSSMESKGALCGMTFGPITEASVPFGMSRAGK